MTLTRTEPAPTYAFWHGMESTSAPAWGRFLLQCDHSHTYVRTREYKTTASMRELVLALKDTGAWVERFAEMRNGGGYMLVAFPGHPKTTDPKAYAYFYVDRSDREITCHVAAASLADADDISQAICDIVPPLPEMPDDLVPVRFWMAGQNGPTSLWRDIKASTWELTKGNYTPNAQDGLGTLMQRHIEEGDGRIGILHGPPGTGKTTAIRTLAREWKHWCAMEYVMDAEQFFGSAKYMMGVLMESDESARPSYYQSAGERAKKLGKWRCIIIEDAEEFLAPDAKSNVGQALARLLNFGDGFLGQGLNVMVLMTTNAPLSKLHPAITRPGRCFSNIEVPQFHKHEAYAWLEARGIEQPAMQLVSKNEYALADLYAVIRKDERVDVAPTVPNRSTEGAYL